MLPDAHPLRLPGHFRLACRAMTGPNRRREAMRYCQVCQGCYGDGVEFCLNDQTPTRNVPSTPQIIDNKYRLERMIARGGMGAVYRARHLTLDRPVAVKILRTEFLADTTIRERFKREAHAVALLKHPNVVSVYDYGLIPGDSPDSCGAFLVMELIEGESLRQRMRAGGLRNGDLRMTVSLFSQICAGVAAAHARGVVHRDLKPDNIMIERVAGSSERVLVLDFGIAKMTGGDQKWERLTGEDMIIGTPNYISPEQCSGAVVDQRSDIYSLGVILYEMLTTAAPFAAPDTAATLLRHLQESPPPISRYRDDLDDRIERVVRRALEKDPARRFDSAFGMAAEFESAVEGLIERRQGTTVKAFDDETVSGAPAQVVVRRTGTVQAAVVALVFATVLAGVYLISGNWSAGAVDGNSEVVAAITPDARYRSSAVLETGAADRSKRELKDIYADWTRTAIRGDLKRHIRLYDREVEYFRDGPLPRSTVEARKRRIFAGIDTIDLKFSDVPSIRMRQKGDAQFADLTFSRRWKLRRGKRRIEGRSRGMITLRRDPDGWLIVSEKQIGKRN